MIQSIKKQIKLSLGDCGIGLGFTAGCVVFGLIFTQMMRVAGPVEPAEMALFTSVFGALGAGIYIALYMGFSLLINFKLQVGMGSTRKDFLVSSYIVGAVSSLVLVFFVAAAAAVSQAAYSRIYGTKDSGCDTGGFEVGDSCGVFTSGREQYVRRTDPAFWKESRLDYLGNLDDRLSWLSVDGRDCFRDARF